MKRLNRSILPDPVRYPIKALFFGGGNFLRGFAAWMIHQMNQQGLFQGGILIVKPTPHGTYDQFRDQEGLFHVLIRGEQDGSNVTENHLVTAVQEVVNPYSDHAAFLKAAEIDSLQVVISNTTESGLTLTGDDRIEDAPPSSFPGKLTQFLWHRFRHFKGADSAGLVILPCELVRNNGYVLLQLLTELSENWELPEEFSNWLQRANTFCNTLVDRIVPGFPDRDAEAIYQELGCRDTLMVQAEPYYLWAIESPHKVSEVLPLGKAGFHVVFSRDISRYRDLKIRILNGAHTAMVPIGLLAGYQKVAEVMLDDDLLHFIDTTIRQEIHPGMSYPQEELDEYTR
ncbi:MAG: tagaturonate reductase, partial [Saprospiraceae bacterium]|nr:tagaturonate reductase [Saprospiraceae bacterium]